MGVHLRKPDYDDREYDNCGSITKAILELDNIIIPLCESCLNDLRDDLKKYDSIIFCHKCENFVMSNSGFHYGGSCKLKARQHDVELTDNLAGYKYCTGCMDTCSDAILREGD